MVEHPYGWLSLAPPVVAIVLAILTRRVVASLLAGVFCGALITAGGNPLTAAASTLEIHLWKTLVDENRLRVFAFTLLMGAMVGVIHRAGGMRGLVDAITPWAQTPRRGQIVTWVLGLLIFFDDYANTVLLGSTLRPLCDRLRISRAKLAYLVDSTAAPVAGLAVVSTWVAGEIDYVRQGLERISGHGLEAFELFMASIPYRFYPLWALVFVFLVAALRRDFGPMRRIEAAALEGNDPSVRPGLAESSNDEAPEKHVPARWYNAVVPIAVTVGVILWLLWQSGSSALVSSGQRPSLIKVFGASDSYFSLLWGSLAGLVTAALMAWGQRILTGPQITVAAQGGGQMMLSALAILWLAASLSGITGNNAFPGYKASAAASDAHDDHADSPASLDSQQQKSEGLDEKFPYRQHRLYTGEFLTGLLGDRLPAWLLPTMVFALSSAISFATGTSWGTMGIVMPLAVPLAYNVVAGAGAPVSAEDPILIATVGSVLAGSIFGDHCSPISDTTILSSQASGCDHIAHVWTQMPYALVVGAISILCGTLPAGLGVPSLVLLPVGMGAMVLFLWVFAKPLANHSPDR